ncbi:hypothetical protein [Psychroserpens sp. MEBiC05023]
MENNLERKNQTKRKNASLTLEEWLTFFFLPFFTPKPNYRDDHFSESELKRFQDYGFENKLKEVKKVKLYGYLFWTGSIFLIAFLSK